MTAAGRLIRLDDSTSLLTKGRFARVAVEVDTATPLVLGTNIKLEGVGLPVFWQRFEFEHIHLFCGRCGRVGHRPSECASSPKRQPTSPPDLTTSSPSDVNMVPADTAPPTSCTANGELLTPKPWIHVRHRGRSARLQASTSSCAKLGRSRQSDATRAASEQPGLLPTPNNALQLLRTLPLALGPSKNDRAADPLGRASSGHEQPTSAIGSALQVGLASSNTNSSRFPHVPLAPLQASSVVWSWMKLLQLRKMMEAQRNRQILIDRTES